MLRYANELGEGFQIREFDGLKSFEERYFSTSQDDKNEDQSKENRSGEEALKKFSAIDLIIIKYNLIEGDFKNWISQIQLNLKGKNLWREGNPTRIILTKYEDDGVKKSDLIHPFLSDLLLLPLDRLIFLQKVEIVLAMPEVTAPSFLYVQDIQGDPVEISKKSKIEFLSDLGLAIRNPISLNPGVLGHFYFEVTGEPTIDVYGKVIYCKPHPEDPNEYLVYFSFFGIRKNALTSIRKYLANDRFYKSLLNQSSEDFAFNPDNIFLTDEQRRPRTIAIIDITPESSESLADSIIREIAPVTVVTEDSLYMFRKRYLSPDQKEKLKQGPPPFASKEDLFDDVVSWSIDVNTTNFQQLLTVPEDAESMESAQVLGHSADSLFTEPQGWKKLFTNSDSEELLEECLHNLIENQRLHKHFELVTPEKESKLVLVEFNLLEDKEHIQINLKLPIVEEVEAHYNQVDVKSIDLLIIERSFLPDDHEHIKVWYESLNAEIKKSGLSANGKDLPIIVVAKESNEFKIQPLGNSPIFSLNFKPVVGRTLLFDISNALEMENTVYNFENIGWKETNIPVYVAKCARLEKISEFGVQLRLNYPIKKGSAIYLHGSIFENAPDGNLCARLYFNKENESHPGFYSCNFLYFGINESFLKFTRSWVRERYAISKEQAE